MFRADRTVGCRRRWWPASPPCESPASPPGGSPASPPRRVASPPRRVAGLALRREQLAKARSSGGQGRISAWEALMRTKSIAGEGSGGLCTTGPGPRELTAGAASTTRRHRRRSVIDTPPPPAQRDRHAATGGAEIDTSPPPAPNLASARCLPTCTRPPTSRRRLVSGTRASATCSCAVSRSEPRRFRAFYIGPARSPALPDNLYNAALPDNLYNAATTPRRRPWAM